jgi:zinc/manganese transport system substrate-binding protein
MLARRSLLLLSTALLAGAGSPPLVVASFSILADMVSEIAGPGVRVASLVGPDQDLHAYEPRPSDLRTLAGADLLVLNGLGVEGWAQRMAQASGFKGRTVIATKGVTPLRPAANGAAGANPSEGEYDPHAWQSVVNAQFYAANIRDGLAALGPGLAAGAPTYLARLAKLDAWVRAALALVPAARRRVITTHDAMAYYGHAYGVTFRAPLGISTEAEPTARQIAELEHQIRDEHITALFFENISNNKLLAQIARDTGARIGGELYSDALSPPDGPAATYEAMIRHNTMQIVAALT